MENTKKCSKCGRILDIACFKSKKGKPYYMCKECEREYMLEYRKRRREHINKQHSEYMKIYMSNSDNKLRLREKARNYQRKRLNIAEDKFRGPNQLEKGQTKYTKSDIDKMSRYGLTPEQFDALPNECEVCGSTTRLCIDHDHITGKFRGVLCQSCNLALGHLHDNPDIIVKLLNYLTKQKSDKAL